MKNIVFIFGFLWLSFAVVSCGGDDENTTPGNGRTNPEPPETPELAFSVTCDERTYSVGEAVDFALTGNAHEIHFYSGEAGSRYDYRDEGEKVQITKVVFNFASQISNLSYDIAAERRRWVKISYDFDGERKSQASIEAATWIDLTDKFALATDNTKVYTGDVDLTSYAAEGPFYFAVGMYHSARNGTSAARSPSFRVREMNFNGTTEYGETIVFINGARLTDSFVGVDFQATDGLGYSNVGADQLRLQYCDNPGEVFGEHDIWMISKQINGKENPLPAEPGEVLKYSYQQFPADYTYTFEAAGEYEVVFVGFDLVEGKEIVEKITVTVQ